MPTPAKVLHHVKRLVASLSISTSTENDIDLLIKTLSSTYREYALEPSGQLRIAVKQALVSATASLDSQQPKVMSLNQMVSNQYRGTASKRHRPIESEEPASDADSTIAADDYYQVSNSTSKRIQHNDSTETDGDSNQTKEKDIVAFSSNDKENKAESTPAVGSSSLSSSGRKKSRSRTSSVKSENNVSNFNSESRNDVETDIVNAIMSQGRARSSEFMIPRPNTRLSDMAGIDSITSQVKELVFYPVLYPSLYNYLGVQPPCGLLLHGPSGCGKTALAYAIAGELGLPFFKASGPELVGGTSGESEERIRDIFLAAAAKAPSVLFIDALDVIAGKKDSAQRGMDRRILAQLFDSIDSIISLGEENLKSSGDDGSSSGGSSSSSIMNNGESSADLSAMMNGAGKTMSASIQTKRGLVVLIAATNKADALDAGVRGRFSRELSLPVPDAPSRTKILALMTARMKLALDVDLTELGRVTPGFVGADLKALAREAGMLAVSRIVDLHPGMQRNSPDDGAQESDVSQVQVPVVNEIGAAENAAVDFEAELLDCEISSFIDTTATMTVEEGIDSTQSGVVEEQCRGTVIIAATATSPLKGSAPTTSNAVDCSQQQVTVAVCAAAEQDIGALIAEPMSHSVAVGMRDFLSAAKSVQPTAKREGFAVVPDVTWGDVGALSEVREELLHNVLEPIAHPERFRALGLEVPAGVLFFGPPGCGKTLLAKALANQSGANFISVKGPELLNMYVGESESRVRQVFSRARASAPCVIFFDELDALCPRRGSGAEGGSGVSERVVNQLLTELDGLETRKDVYIIAATNRLELIDEAMLRPGRLGKLLYVPLPNASDRIAILTALVRKVSIDRTGVDIAAIGGDPRTEGFSGADMAALVREAGLAVVRELMSKSRGKDAASDASAASVHPTGPGNEAPSSGAHGERESAISEDGGGSDSQEIVCISARHFESALQRVRPSVALQDRLRYERVQQNIKDGMGAIQALSAAALKLPPIR